MLEALPHEPIELEDLHIPWSLLEDLVLRRAFLDGHSSTVELAEALCVSPMVMEHAIEELRHNQLVEVQGRERRNYFIAVTEIGHEQVMERMAICRYAGAVPVSLADYTAIVRAQDEPTVASHASLRQAFHDLVMSDNLFDSLGPAIRSEGAIFLYGPPGTGKSAIAERLNRIHADWVIVPRAVEVDGQIISVFDPVVHRPAAEQPDRLDRRWVLCHRPSVIVGGELIGSQLNLTYESHAGIYLAPIQMQANNGILVIDDFGRQVLTPEQLLNRWIVPLDRSIDYLALDYGVKFEVPCVAKIVFSTNLAPSSLADEAFFRRIRSKVLIPAIEDAAFDEILRRVAAATGVTVTPDAPAHLRTASRERGDGDLRPYLPGAVCELVRSIADYDEIPAVLDPAMVDRIAELYFTQDPGVQAARAANLGSGVGSTQDEPGGHGPGVRVADHRTLSRVLARLSTADTVVVVALDGDAADSHDRPERMADLGAVLASEARGHDHIGQYSPDRFVAVLATDPDDGHRAGEAFMRRVHERWIEQRSAPVDITAGIAPARLGTDTAVLAALHANERAAPSGDAPWVCAVATDYA